MGTEYYHYPMLLKVLIMSSTLKGMIGRGDNEIFEFSD